MPRKTTVNDEHNTMWNFYVNKIEQLEFIKCVAENGHSRAQSATLRALMHLYIEDKDVQVKVNNIVDNFIVYKKNDEPSLK